MEENNENGLGPDQILNQDRFGRDVPASQSLIYALMLMQIIDPIRM
jgi:hypothetical protein